MYPLKIYISVSLNKLHTCVTTTPVVYKMFPSLCKVPLCFFVVNSQPWPGWFRCLEDGCVPTKACESRDTQCPAKH